MTYTPPSENVTRSSTGEPNPQDWLSGLAAARLLGGSRQLVYRLVVAGVLTAYRLDDNPKSLLLWRAEVEQVAAARRLLAGGRGAAA